MLVDTPSGKVHEIFWKEITVGIEAHYVLPVSFPPTPFAAIASVSRFHSTDDQRQHVIGGTIDGNVHNLSWRPGQ